MRINCSISTIDEEAKFTKTTTIADKFINVCMSFRVSCALECEICKMSALSFFYSFCQCFDSRILIEPCAVLVHAVERAKTTGILRFNSRVVVQGCGPIGLICIAVLRTMGIEHICAVDGNEKRLEFAKRMGADTSVNFMNFKGIEALTEAVKEAQGGHLADFAFQCTGNPKAHANIYKFIRNGGGLCELGFFINGGDATINPHFDLCSKEINLVGSWVYTLRDYVTTFDFLKRASLICSNGNLSVINSDIGRPIAFALLRKSNVVT